MREALLSNCDKFFGGVGAEIANGPVSSVGPVEDFVLSSGGSGADAS